jgi:cell division protein ZapB
MEENEKKGVETPKQDKTRVILLVISVVLLLVVGTFLYLSNQESQRLQAENEATELELEKTYLTLDSMSQNLVLKIQEVESLGQSVKELEDIKQQLEEDKKRIRRAKDIEIKELRDKVEGYTELLKAKDVEIEQLRSANEALLTENTTLKTEKEELSESIQSLNQERRKLAQKVAQASRLKAENVTFTSINSRGREKEGTTLRSRQITDLKVAFNLAKNEVAPIGGKEILIRILDQTGNVIFDVAKGSGSFIVDGKEVFYTSKKDILFDNTGQKLSFTYTKGSEWAVGNYTLEIYADKLNIGSANFVVR